MSAAANSPQSTQTPPSAEERYSYEVRFRFLFWSCRPAFRLHPPDALELRWSVFDHTRRVTVAFGATPEQAVDNALDHLNAVAAQ